MCVCVYIGVSIPVHEEGLTRESTRARFWNKCARAQPFPRPLCTARVYGFYLFFFFFRCRGRRRRRRRNVRRGKTRFRGFFFFSPSSFVAPRETLEYARYWLPSTAIFTETVFLFFFFLTLKKPRGSPRRRAFNPFSGGHFVEGNFLRLRYCCGGVFFFFLLLSKKKTVPFYRTNRGVGPIPARFRGERARYILREKKKKFKKWKARRKRFFRKAK